MAGSGAVAGRSVGVWSGNSWERELLTVWMSRFGYPVVAVETDGLASTPPPVVVIGARDRHALYRCGRPVTARIVVVGGRIEKSDLRAGVHHVADGADVEERLALLLTRILGPTSGRTALTAREREILTTYVLGATVEETAARHFVAASTVRTHYRRVSSRYEDAGWPVANKAQLLLRMVADGWIRLDGVLPESDAGPAPESAGCRAVGVA
ncbi:response regulator transcription factor [Gordonia sp. (in: high G+C Gram-positive bacteria)]|uniref:response regulator transcription factor n=1 Tax=Gordonia sp. (in: high G+C Gram-positive bacteria) TaxID=84139 RepID=UPI003C7434DD